MPAKGVTSHHFASARFLEPLSRTFMGLEFRHRNSVDLLQQVRLKNYSIAGRGKLGCGIGCPFSTLSVQHPATDHLNALNCLLL